MTSVEIIHVLSALGFGMTLALVGIHLVEWWTNDGS